MASDYPPHYGRPPVYGGKSEEEKLRERIADLQRQLAAAIAGAKEWKAEYETAKRQLAEAKATVKWLRAAIDKYGTGQLRDFLADTAHINQAIGETNA